MSCDATMDEIALLASGELAAERSKELEEHLAACAACRRRLDALRQLDADLGLLPRLEPPAGPLVRVRRALSRELRETDQPELMTLEEVADFLRISLDELEEIVLDLPAFEVAGQIRVRRARLIDWIEGRERAFTRSTAQAEVARILSAAL